MVARCGCGLELSLTRFWMTQLPQPFMRRDKAFHAASACTVQRRWTAAEHQLKHLQQA